MGVREDMRQRAYLATGGQPLTWPGWGVGHKPESGLVHAGPNQVHVGGRYGNAATQVIDAGFYSPDAAAIRGQLCSSFQEVAARIRGAHRDPHAVGTSLLVVADGHSVCRLVLQGGVPPAVAGATG